MKSRISIIGNKSLFYNVYEEDAYIINELFNYKILDNKKLGFPQTAINKVKDKLDEVKVSYEIINSGEETIIKKYTNNNYVDYYNKARDKMGHLVKIELVIEKLNNMNKSDFNKVLDYKNEY